MTSFSLEGAIEILSRTPSVVSSLLEDLSDTWIFSTEGENTWSAFDIVGHLIHGEKTDWIARMNIILTHGDSVPFEPFDRFRQEIDSKGQSMQQLLTEFSNLREQTVSALRDGIQSPEVLQAVGLHPELGPVTMSELLSAWVVHDLGHIAQICRAMAKHYREDVGPWAAYLPVVADR